MKIYEIQLMILGCVPVYGVFLLFKYLMNNNEIELKDKKGQLTNALALIFIPLPIILYFISPKIGLVFFIYAPHLIVPIQCAYLINKRKDVCSRLKNKYSIALALTIFHLFISIGLYVFSYYSFVCDKDGCAALGFVLMFMLIPIFISFLTDKYLAYAILGPVFSKSVYFHFKFSIWH